MKRKNSDTVELKVRMKEPLRKDIEYAAKQRGISLNAEACERLKRTFRDDEVLAAIDRLERRLTPKKVP